MTIQDAITGTITKYEYVKLLIQKRYSKTVQYESGARCALCDFAQMRAGRETVSPICRVVLVCRPHCPVYRRYHKVCFDEAVLPERLYQAVKAHQWSLAEQLCDEILAELRQWAQISSKTEGSNST